jgi:ATP/maltotriose-dependent transcriptional regulator MalT/DNA-binding SARP family transcriptional activator
MTGTSTLAKCSPPRLGAVFARERLYAALDTACARPIVWVAGAPGAGKTTLVSGYIAARELRTLWYQLDAGDSDPATFFHYLSLAAKTLAPRKRATLPTLTPQHLPSLAAYARDYFERLGALCASPMALVLDNYQEVAPESSLHALLAEALPLLPAHVRVVIISRAEPPAAYARLRVNRHVALVGADELKLDAGEAVGLARHLGYDAAPEHVTRLHEQTQGWTAGLLLLLEHSGNVSTLETHAATAEVLFDYFATEVLHKMDERTQRMLLQLAFLPDTTAPLACALTRDEGASTLLEQLAQRHYFTQRHHANETVSYQFPPLFKAFLQAQARTVFTLEQLAQLQRHAAQLLLESGSPEDAAGLLCTAQDWRALAQLIATHAPSLARQGRLQTLVAWIGMVPVAMCEQAPWLLYWLGAGTLTRQPVDARRHLMRAYELFDQQDNCAGLYLAWAGVVDGFTVAWNDFVALDPWIAAFDELRKRFPVIPDPAIAARVVFAMMAIIMHRRPDHPDADYWLSVARALLTAATEPTQRLLIGSYLVIYQIWRGEMRDAAYLAETLEPLARGEDVAPLVRIFWHVASAMRTWTAHDPEHALVEVHAALQLAEQSGVHSLDYRLCLHAVYASLTAGDLAAAQRYLQEVEAAMQRSGRDDPSAIHHMHSLLHLHRGDYAAAAPHARQAVTYAVEYGNVFHEVLSRVCHGHVLHTCGATAEAEQEIAHAADIAARARIRPMEILCEMNRALFALDRNDTAGATIILRRTLALSRELNLGSNPYFEPQTLVRLYHVALEHGIEVEYVRAMIHRLRLVPDAAPVDVEHWPWRIRIRTLGRFDVTVDDVPIDTSGNAARKPLDLLKTLIALGGREVSQQKIINALWSDADGDAGRKAFEIALHRLRKILGVDAPLILKNGMLTLDARLCWVDCWTLERMLTKLGSAASVSDGEALLAKVFGLYQGVFLGREEESPWALPLQEKLRARLLRVVLRAAQDCENAARWDMAQRGYEFLMEAEPTAEEPYRRLVRLHQQQGRHADALACYRRCERILLKLLGVAPSFALDAPGAATDPISLPTHTDRNAKRP